MALTRRAVIATAGGLAALGAGASREARAAVPGEGGSRGDGTTVRLRLLETSDLHMFARDYDYYRDRQDDTVGLAKVATLVAAARAEAPNSLLFDNGDILQGNPLGDYVALKQPLPSRERVHPMFRAMNLLGYDAGTLGNHEFNYGLPFLDAALAGAEFPFVCANLKHVDGTDYLKPYVVLDRRVRDESGAEHVLRVGVLGLVTPQIMVWDQTHLAGKVQAPDIVDTARRYVPELRERCDLLVVLSHSGISGAPRRGGDENASLFLAEVPGIDVIFTGHEHRVFPGPFFADQGAGVDAARGTLHGVPAVMPGFWGSHLGVIDLELRRDAAGARPWRVAGFHVEARPIYRR
ncbi:MAG: metallophosphoesterase, partial [Gluconacetobacter diazotrophicus]|nr:metallophosphoesterase [Gluconacetobacter diazotrophicus]